MKISAKEKQRLEIIRTATDADQMLRDLNALEERSLLKRLQNMIRGEFMGLERLMNVVAKELHYFDDHLWEDEPYVKIGNLKISASDADDIVSESSCPCGNCQYYTLELFSDGRYHVHHHGRGIIKSGTVEVQKR